jgi:hypothetical protein
VCVYVCDCACEHICVCVCALVRGPLLVLTGVVFLSDKVSVCVYV